MSGRALVTGACGFMGRRMCERLVEERYEVRATDLADADRGGIEDLDVRFVPADLTDPDGLDEVVEDIDVVFHTAAIFSYSSLLDWEVFERVNVGGTENLLDAAVDAGVESVVQWSSQGVYGPPREDFLPIEEDHPKNPESNYDRSKWLQERKAMGYHDEFGLDVRAIRPGSVYGPGNTYGAAQVVLAIARGRLNVYPLFCDHHFPLVHVEDVIRSALHVLGSGEAGEAYNVVDDQGYTAARFVKGVAAMSGNHAYGLPIGCDSFERISGLTRILPAVERVYDALDREPPVEADVFHYFKRDYHVSNRKIRETGFGFDYPSFRDGIPETLDWYREEGML